MGLEFGVLIIRKDALVNEIVTSCTLLEEARQSLGRRLSLLCSFGIDDGKVWRRETSSHHDRGRKR